MRLNTIKLKITPNLERSYDHTPIIIEYRKNQYFVANQRHYAIKPPNGKLLKKEQNKLQHPIENS